MKALATVRLLGVIQGRSGSRSANADLRVTYPFDLPSVQVIDEGGMAAPVRHTEIFVSATDRIDLIAYFVGPIPVAASFLNVVVHVIQTLALGGV